MNSQEMNATEAKRRVLAVYGRAFVHRQPTCRYPGSYVVYNQPTWAVLGFGETKDEAWIAAAAGLKTDKTGYSDA